MAEKTLDQNYRRRNRPNSTGLSLQKRFLIDDYVLTGTAFTNVIHGTQKWANWMARLIHRSLEIRQTNQFDFRFRGDFSGGGIRYDA